MIKYRILSRSILCGAFIIFSSCSVAQNNKKFIRQGNREYEKSKFSDSEISYRKAISTKKESADAVFNIGDALYKQNKFEDAGKQFMENIDLSDDKTRKSAGLYNLGNSLLKANKIQESIDAYKGSLKLLPDNIQAKYNLSYAQDLLRQQQEQQEQQKQNQDKNNKDQNKDKNKDDQNKDNKDNKDQKDKDQDQKNDKDQKNDQKQQQSISKEDAQRLLNALANDEKNVQEKVKLAKAAKTKSRTVKNW